MAVQRRAGRRGELRPALRAHEGVLERPARRASPRSQLPDLSLADAYRSGFIYTQIIRSGDQLSTGANGYDTEFSHDVIGILANLFTQGYFTGAHALLNRARYVVGTQSQYDDGVWTYPWLWAIYLLKTGDLGFVKANFDTEGPAGQDRAEHRGHRAPDRRRPDRAGRDHGEDQRHRRQRLLDDRRLRGADRAWPPTGSWPSRSATPAEAKWAAAQYNSLLAATNKTLNATIAANHLNYLPCSMIEPNTANRCANPEDANWAAPFLFGRWAWDGYLFGARLSGPGHEPDRRHVRLRLRPAAGQAAAQHVRRLPDAVLHHRLQRGTASGGWPARSTGTRASSATSS